MLMLKLAIVTLCLLLAVTRFAARFMPAEMRRAAQILTWLLSAYVVIMLLLGVIATFNGAWK